MEVPRPSGSSKCPESHKVFCAWFAFFNTPSSSSPSSIILFTHLYLFSGIPAPTKWRTKNPYGTPPTSWGCVVLLISPTYSEPFLLSQTTAVYNHGVGGLAPGQEFPLSLQLLNENQYRLSLAYGMSLGLCPSNSELSGSHLDGGRRSGLLSCAT